MKGITHGSANPADRQNKFCVCSRCGVVAECTLFFDFYGSEGKPLICEWCFAAEHLFRSGAITGGEKRK